MVNRSYWKNVRRTVRSTLSRFLAIFAIVGLGVGFLAGLLASPEDMRLSADRYYQDTRMYDLRVVSTLGLTDEDLDLVREAEGVAEVLPVRDRDLVALTQEGESLTVRTHTLSRPEDPPLNLPILQEGRLPEAAGECAVVLTKSLTEEKDWIGQTLTVDRGEDESLPEPLTVVGTVKSALYLSMEKEHTTVGSGTVGLAVYTPESTLDLDYYTGFYLTLTGAGELGSFSKTYQALAEETVDRLTPLGEARSQARYDQLKEDASAELDDARAEYFEEKEKAQRELDDAEQRLEDARREIADHEAELDEARERLAEGEAELADQRAAYETQIADAQAQIDSGSAQLTEGQSQLAGGMAQLADAQTRLDAGEEELRAGEARLALAQAELAGQEEQIAALEAGLAALWQTVDRLGLPGEDRSDAAALAALDQLAVLSPEGAAAFAELKAGLEALSAQGTDTAAARQALEAGKAALAQEVAAAQAARAQLTQTIADAEARFAQAEKDLADGRQEIDDGAKALEDARAELADGEREYEDARAEADEQLADAWEQILDGESELRRLEAGKWYFFTREDNAAYASYGSNADKIAAIAKVFPAFFFLVAALVALTTMTRLVEEERGQIGTLKALGYGSGNIAAKYLLYAAIAAVAGSIFGLAVGLRLFPTVIINAYNIMYDVPKALTPFQPRYALLSSGAAVACTLAATLSACWAELREVPARLMLPKAPKAGKRVFLERITPLWRRMKFTHKVTARNLIRYKKRFFMTVIGIAGCTALLVTGFGIKDSIGDIVALQFGELDHYQLTVALSSADALQGRELRALLDDDTRISGCLPVLENSGKVVPRDGAPADALTILVPSDAERLPDFFTFRHRLGGGPISFGEDSVIVTEKLAERQNLRAGDTLTVTNQDGREAAFTVTEICENYVQHYLFLPPAAYERAFGQAPEINTVLCALPEGGASVDEKSLSTDLLACRDVAAAVFTTELAESFTHTIQSLDSITLVLILSAGALAFVVLYNLTNINISERVKEIATIKVLGFFDGEVSAYVYRENAVLTLIGTTAGLGLGVLLHQFVIRTAEIDIVMFGRSVYPPSFVWSALLTVAFSVLVNLHRRLKKISMVESMKAPE